MNSPSVFGHQSVVNGRRCQNFAAKFKSAIALANVSSPGRSSPGRSSGTPKRNHGGLSHFKPDGK